MPRPATIAIDARKAADFGIGTYVRRLVAAIGAIDAETRYLLLVGPPGFGGPPLPANFHLVETRAAGYSLGELASIPWQLRRIGTPVDLYHAPHYVLPPALPCPSVVTVHDAIHILFPHFLPHPLLGRLYARRMIGHALRAARRVIAVSLATKRDLLRLFPGTPARRIRTIHNGVDLASFEPTGSADASRADAERRSAAGFGRRPYLLFVGNAKPHKNLATVGSVWRAVRARGGPAFDLDLVIVGSGPTPDLAALAAAARDQGLADRLITTGTVAPETLAAAYRGAAAVLFPSLHEGFGLPVLEAMAAGAPVVASSAGSLPEIAGGGGDAADLLDPGDVLGFTTAVERLLLDPDHRRRRIDAGHRRARRFAWSRAAEKTVRVYRQALAGRPPKGG